MILKFHHLGLCCANIKNEIKIFKKLGGINFSKIYKDKNLKVSVCFFKLGGILYELVEPYGQKSPIHNLLNKKIRI